MNKVNDSWASEPSTGLLLKMKETAGNNMTLLEAVVTIAEVDTIKHEQSASLHYFLASLYQSLPEELTAKAMEKIERKKLEAQGKEHLLDISPDEAYSLGIRGELSFSDYSLLWRRSHYLTAETNAKRAVYHLITGIEHSRDNPEPYKDTLGTVVLSFVLDKRTAGLLYPVQIAIQHCR